MLQPLRPQLGSTNRCTFLSLSLSPLDFWLARSHSSIFISRSSLSLFSDPLAERDKWSRGAARSDKDFRLSLSLLSTHSHFCGSSCSLRFFSFSLSLSFFYRFIHVTAAIRSRPHEPGGVLTDLLILFWTENFRFVSYILVAKGWL